MPLYLVKSPASGNWICAPLGGASANIEDAHPYRHDDPFLEHMVKCSLHLGRRLILRQLPDDAQVAVITCPECRGTGDSREAPFFECHHCRGLKVVYA